MRIISGKFKGRRLGSFNAKHIRPTTDREKESIFNKLMADIPGARVLDLFSGTGNLGLEAHSRGADFVQCVEFSKKSIKIIHENIKLLGIEDGIEVTFGDVMKFLQKYDGEPFDVVLADPPFTEAMAHSVMETISRSSVCKPGTVVVIEAGGKERLDEQYQGFNLLDRKDFGDKSVAFFERLA